jgi:NAD kinase
MMNVVTDRPRDEARASPRGALFERVVVVTRETELEQLIARFNTVPQARFYLEHAGQDFDPIEEAQVRRAVPRGLKFQAIGRGFLPQYRFEGADLVVTVGPDGLVVNTAKYLSGQPILPVNPDPATIEGVLVPFEPGDPDWALGMAITGDIAVREVSMAEARLGDGQRLLAFNDLFIGARSHVSARYRLEQDGRAEEHSSSGIIVSTGAGSTGWMRSVHAGAVGVASAMGRPVTPPPNGGRIPWDSDHLLYAVREPWPSKATGADMVYGNVESGCPLIVESHMADNGVIFSDGVEADYLPFNTGATATIAPATHKATLLFPK